MRIWSQLFGLGSPRLAWCPCDLMMSFDRVCLLSFGRNVPGKVASLRVSSKTPFKDPRPKQINLEWKRIGIGLPWWGVIDTTSRQINGFSPICLPWYFIVCGVPAFLSICLFAVFSNWVLAFWTNWVFAKNAQNALFFLFFFAQPND